MDQTRGHTTHLRFLPSAQRHSYSSNIYSTPPPNYPYHHQLQHQRVNTSLKRPRLYDEDVGENGALEDYVNVDHQTPVGQTLTPHYYLRQRSTDKTRGLRHFAHKVCEKVKNKGQTNYNEVADELVTEYFDNSVMPQDPEKYQYDVRNIRRRVYDALNVLMAMNIIEKEKKEIRWVGLPTSSLAECRRLEEELAQRKERIRQKTEQLQELIVQLVAYKSLVQRNRERERINGRPPNSAILYLPYIIVSTERKTMVECAIAPDKSEYWFNFDRPFEIHDDIEVLKRLGLAYGIERGEVPAEHVPHIKACLPPALRDYVDQIVEGTLTNTDMSQSNETTSKDTLSSSNSISKFQSPPTSSTDPIVVRATRANLSGVAPTGDGGPLGSFLSPMSKQIQPVKSQSVSISNFTQIQQQPVARCAVIPRPVNTRYSPRYWQNPVIASRQPLISTQHPIRQSQQIRRPQQRLGGVLHYEVPINPPRVQQMYQQPYTRFVYPRVGYGSRQIAHRQYTQMQTANGRMMNNYQFIDRNENGYIRGFQHRQQYLDDEEVENSRQRLQHHQSIVSGAVEEEVVVVTDN
uniref:Transcription factor Dp-1 n=1 Tax=Meloidogyne hapla TaxID=6305 RepID=A0A1I8B088_MELHA